MLVLFETPAGYSLFQVGIRHDMSAAAAAAAAAAAWRTPRGLDVPLAPPFTLHIEACQLWLF